MPGACTPGKAGGAGTAGTVGGAGGGGAGVAVAVGVAGGVGGAGCTAAAAGSPAAICLLQPGEINSPRLLSMCSNANQATNGSPLSLEGPQASSNSSPGRACRRH